MSGTLSPLFDEALWRVVPGFEDLSDITYHQDEAHSMARVAFNRPEVRNAFRPHTVDELYRVLDHARLVPTLGAVILTGNGPSPTDGGWAFCSGGDQRIRGKDGYQYSTTEDASGVDQARAGRLHILEVQRLIRFMPKVVIAAIPGWAAGGGHSLHVVCDLSIASAEHARFKQTDVDVGSFDGGYGSAYFAKQVGQKFAREVFFPRTGIRRPPSARDGCGERGGSSRGTGASCCVVGADDSHQEPHSYSDGQVCSERHRRWFSRPAGFRRGGNQARLWNR
jgi:naphthoate synthase